MDEDDGILGSPRGWAIDLAVATGIGVFFAIIGPFGSFTGGSLEYRLFFWVANMWMGLIVLSLGVRASLRAIRGLDVPIWFALPVSIAIAALPLSLLVALFSVWFWPGAHGRMGPMLEWYGQTLAIAEPCGLGYYFLLDRRHARAGRGRATAPAAAGKGGRFIDRLPARLGRNLLCLQMEDHYVRAHTELGSDLILIPLKAAMAELTEIDGLQVHRSWWVARRAVATTVVSGRSYALKLINGLEVPVSRASVAKARALGWL